MLLMNYKFKQLRISAKVVTRDGNKTQCNKLFLESEIAIFEGGSCDLKTSWYYN
jgi:hypothetical protein